MGRRPVNRRPGASAVRAGGGRGALAAVAGQQRHQGPGRPAHGRGLGGTVGYGPCRRVCPGLGRRTAPGTGGAGGRKTGAQERAGTAALSGPPVPGGGLCAGAVAGVAPGVGAAAAAGAQGDHEAVGTGHRPVVQDDLHRALDQDGTLRLHGHAPGGRAGGRLGCGSPGAASGIRHGRSPVPPASRPRRRCRAARAGPSGRTGPAARGSPRQPRPVASPPPTGRPFPRRRRPR